MSDYKTNITNLYNLRTTLEQLQDNYDLFLSKLAVKENPKWRNELEILKKKIVQTKLAINDSITQLYADSNTDPLNQIGEANPLILLPLRLETRFVNTVNELWIRVYPDDIAIQTHESALTESEIKAGHYYWKSLWEKSTSADFAVYRKKTYSQVANRFGMNRAAWIVLKTQPLNLKPNEDFSFILNEKDLDPGPIEKKDQAWSEAAKSFVMPDLLKLRIYIADIAVFEMQGKPIVYPLPVGPDPKIKNASTGLDWKGTDLEWLEDFDKAVEVGMGFKINLTSIPNYDKAQGFSRITVMGIRTLFEVSPLVVSPPVAGIGLLSKLFENHQYTVRGLSLVSQGTPTNNTEEKRSGYREQPAFSEERYQQDLQQVSQTIDPDEMKDGKILANALGLDPTLFEKIENSQNEDHREAVYMNKALYPATLGFFLGNLLHPLFKEAELESIQSFFCSYVTGRGPLPVLRTGAQPYGILPTSNFKAFQWDATNKDYKLFQRLIALLGELDAIYEAGIPAISKLGQSKDPHIIIDEVLGLYPNSESFYQRVGYSESFLRDYLGKPVAPNSNLLLEQLIQRFSTYSGITAEGILELKKIIFEGKTNPLNSDKLVDLVNVSETNELSIPDKLSPLIHHGKNYIQWLNQYYARAPFAVIEKDYYSGTDPKIEPPLLYSLLKHSMLIQLHKCVFHLLSTRHFLDPDLSLLHNGNPNSNFIDSKEYLNFFQSKEDISAMELLLIEAPHLPFLKAGETVASYVLEHADQIKSLFIRTGIKSQVVNDFNDMKAFFLSLENLSILPTARLERIFIEHLDCLSYRLDAWQTGLFYKKLESNRNSSLASGTILGAYGWLENLKPAVNINYMAETDLPKELQPGSGMPVISIKDLEGYIHAPSITQAKTAALLRNAYLHYHNPTDPEMMAVNLSSNRVRKALEIFEGMQKGHSINELLGYRLERHLHDLVTPLDKYIPVFRKAFPLGGTTFINPGSNHDQPSATDENKPADWVARMDGLTIVNAIKGGLDYPYGLTTQLPATGSESEEIKKGIADLQDTLDAMKDLIVTESIHQLVQGNTDRAGALLKSIHELKPPPKFESIHTPRTAADILTHRACVLFKPGNYNRPVNPWPSVDMSQRASAEPGLNEWLGEIIGPPDTFQCKVTETDSRTNGIITIEDLNLQPIDLVYLVPAQFDKEDSEFSRRIVHHYRTTQNIKEEITIRIEYDKAVKNNSSMIELLPLLKLLKEIVTNSKALDAADFDLKQYQGKVNFRNLRTKKSGDIILDVGNLMERKDKLKTTFIGLQKKLQKICDTPSSTCADIRECLIECCDFEISDAFPRSSVEENKKLKTDLLMQSAEVIIKMGKMLDSLKKFNHVNEDDLIQSFNIFFGPAFKVLPVFHFATNEDEEVKRDTLVRESFNAEQNIFSFITGKTNISFEKHLQNWLNEVTYLRPKLGAFETARLLYNSFQEKELELHVMQLPYETGDSWLGLEFPPATSKGKGKLSMLIHHAPQNIVPDWESSDFSGLLIDEWVEEIPGNEELTGISFQYTQPDSQPPQVILLAISPFEGGEWSWDKLNDVLDDTMRRTKQRAVGPVELSKTGWINMLPAIIAEFSETKANISLFFKN